MNRFLQVLSILAIATGTSLFVSGGYYADIADSENKVTEKSSYYELRKRRWDLNSAANARGSGAGLIVLGVLGLVVPVINVRKRTSGNSGTSPPEKPQS